MSVVNVLKGIIMWVIYSGVSSQEWVKLLSVVLQVLHLSHSLSLDGTKESEGKQKVLQVNYQPCWNNNCQFNYKKPGLSGGCFSLLLETFCNCVLCIQRLTWEQSTFVVSASPSSLPVCWKNICLKDVPGEWLWKDCLQIMEGNFYSNLRKAIVLLFSPFIWIPKIF